MDASLFYKKFELLPDELKKEAMDFIDFLFAKSKEGAENKKDESEIQPSGKPPKAGFLKGAFIMMPDFDEPLEDFKEYM